MKLNKKRTVILIITFLIIVLSFGLSIANYWSAFEQTRKQLRENSLPLSTDNIYADIQKIIIEPSLISSMMSTDTFVHEWFKNEDASTDKIVTYLDAIRKKYNFSDTFLVSTATNKYYTNKGFLEVMSPDKKDNQWYFRFYKQSEHHEINIDNNELLDNNLLLFFNYKIFNKDNDILGIVGVVFKTSYISKMFKNFKDFYKLNVFLVDNAGNIKLSEQGIGNNKKNIEQEKISQILPELQKHKSTILDYDFNSKEYIVKSKYIKELDLYLVVQAELEQFTLKHQNRLIANLIISSFITAIILFIIIRSFIAYAGQLSKLAKYDALTNLPNRHTFNENFTTTWHQYNRNKEDTSLILFDLDNFKLINDTFGHTTGDQVLIRIAEILREHIRKSDYISRWGGEEFSILLINSNVENAIKTAEKILNTLSKDSILKELTKKEVTASFGITAFTDKDSTKDIFAHADTALYKAKQSGKNCIEVYTK